VDAASLCLCDQVLLPLPGELHVDFRMDVHDVIDGTGGAPARHRARLPIFGG
jgi:hypothetical protein